MSILLNQNQIRGLTETLQSLQDQLSDMDCFPATGGLMTGELTINGTLTVNGGFSVSGSVFTFDTGNGRFGINHTAPSGSVHLRSSSENVSIWLDSNPNGGSPSLYPSIKFLNSSSGVSCEVGVASPSALPFVGASGNGFFVNHGADLVLDESAEDRVIQFAVKGSPSLQLFSDRAEMDAAIVGGNRVSSISASVSGQESTIDTVNMSQYRGAIYNIAVQNETGSRSEQFSLSWNSGLTSLSFTGLQSPSVNSTSDIQISGYKSGNFALLRASAASDAWNISAVRTYLS
jgi:hypothetical protein